MGHHEKMLSNTEVRHEVLSETHGDEGIDLDFAKTSGFYSQDSLNLTGETTSSCSTTSLFDLSASSDSEKYREQKIELPRVGIRYTRLNYKREKTGEGNGVWKPCIVVTALLVIIIVFILIFYLCSRPGLGSPLDEDIEEARSWYSSGAGVLCSSADLFWIVGIVLLSYLLNMY